MYRVSGLLFIFFMAVQPVFSPVFPSWEGACQRMNVKKVFACAIVADLALTGMHSAADDASGVVKARAALKAVCSPKQWGRLSKEVWHVCCAQKGEKQRIMRRLWSFGKKHRLISLAVLFAGAKAGTLMWGKHQKEKPEIADNGLDQEIVQEFFVPGLQEGLSRKPEVGVMTGVALEHVVKPEHSVDEKLKTAHKKSKRLKRPVKMKRQLRISPRYVEKIKENLRSRKKLDRAISEAIEASEQRVEAILACQPGDVPPSPERTFSKKSMGKQVSYVDAGSVVTGNLLSVLLDSWNAKKRQKTLKMVSAKGQHQRAGSPLELVVEPDLDSSFSSVESDEVVYERADEAPASLRSLMDGVSPIEDVELAALNDGFAVYDSDEDDARTLEDRDSVTATPVSLLGRISPVEDFSDGEELAALNEAFIYSPVEQDEETDVLTSVLVKPIAKHLGDKRPEKVSFRPDRVRRSAGSKENHVPVVVPEATKKKRPAFGSSSLRFTTLQTRFF